jgi:type VI secretion system protein ImpH
MAAESWDASPAVTTQTTEKRRNNPRFAFARCWKKSRFACTSFRLCACCRRWSRSCKPVGYFITPQGETIRFSARTSLAFPPSEIYELRRAMENGQMSMTVEFMGLCAAISVMPAPYTEFLLARARQKDYAMEDFLNIFNHRMISFFYRGWEKYRFFIEYERTGEDRLSGRLLDLLGLGTEGCAVEAEFRTMPI